MTALAAVVGPLLDARPGTHAPHPMHARNREWPQTNCAVDLWIELVHAMRLDPVPLAACALSADMRADQWLFLKFPTEDLRRLYGVTVDELTVWRPMLDHVVEHVAAGRLLTIEVDGWFLPDTAGVSYHLGHAKTTIVPNLVDPAGRRMEYFHNEGYYELAGDDFDGVLRVGEPVAGERLAPYVEVVGLDATAATGDLAAAGRQLAREHLARRRPGNPVDRLAERIRRDLPWLAGQDLATFHRYAFATVRQCGATAQLAGDFARWLAAHGCPGLGAGADAFAAAAAAAKTLQFQLARAARGRPARLEDTFAAMAAAWQQGMDSVAAGVG